MLRQLFASFHFTDKILCLGLIMGLMATKLLFAAPKGLFEVGAAHIHRKGQPLPQGLII